MAQNRVKNMVYFLSLSLVCAFSMWLAFLPHLFIYNKIMSFDLKIDMLMNEIMEHRIEVKNNSI